MRKILQKDCFHSLAMTILVIASLCCHKICFGSGEDPQVYAFFQYDLSQVTVYCGQDVFDPGGFYEITNVNSKTHVVKFDAYPKLGYVCNTFSGWYVEDYLDDNNHRSQITKEFIVTNTTDVVPFSFALNANGLISLSLQLCVNVTSRVYQVTLEDGSSSPRVIGVQYGATYGALLQNGELPTPQRTGYSFLGWYENEAGHGDPITGESLYKPENPSNHSLYAKWAENTYWLNLYQNDGSGGSKSLYRKYSVSEPLPFPSSRTGYQFTYWTKNQEDSPELEHYSAGASVSLMEIGATGNIDLYAQWAPITYTYRYAPGRAKEGSVTQEKQCVYGESLTLADPNALGYKDETKVFTGWVVSGIFIGGAGDVVSNLTDVAGRRVDLTAQWRDKVYELCFDKNNEFASGSMESVSNKWGVAFKLPGSGFRNDVFKFLGWSRNPDDTMPEWKRGDEVRDLVESGSVILYAVWEDLRDGDFRDATGCGNLIVTSEDFPDGKGKSWVADVNKQYAYSQNDSATIESSPSQLTAIIPGAGVLEFDWRFEGADDDRYYRFDYEQDKDSGRIPAIGEWRHEKWVYASDAVTNIAAWRAYGNQGRLQVKNIRWTRGVRQEDLKWYLSYDAGEGTPSAAMTNCEYVVGAGADKLVDLPTWAGWEVGGWWTTNRSVTAGGAWKVNDGFRINRLQEGDWVESTPQLNESYIVHVRWQKSARDSYVVSFDKNSGLATGSMESFESDCGSSFPLPACKFSRPRLRFLGWSTNALAATPQWQPGDSVKDLGERGEVVVVYAVWSPPETWTLAYDENEGSKSAAMTNVVIEVGKPYYYYVLNREDGPTREDYALMGWTDEKGSLSPKWTPGALLELEVKKDVKKTLYAVWSTDVYTLVFVGNGATNEMAAAKMSYSDNQQLPMCRFKNPGHSFYGWAERAFDARAGERDYVDGATLAKPLAPQGCTKTLYAVWTNNTYKISFDKNSAAASGTMEALNCEYGKSYVLPAAGFVRPLFACVGWTNAVGQVFHSGETVMNLAESGEVGLYACWEDMVTKEQREILGCDNLVFAVGTGWTYGDSQEDGIVSDGSGCSALCAEIPGCGKLEFEWCGVSGEADEYCFLADGISDSGRRAAIGGWQKVQWIYESDSPYVARWEDLSAKGSLRIRKVHWTSGKFDPKWYLAYDANGGVASDAMLTEQMISVGAVVRLLSADKNPTYAGHEFKGWSTSPRGVIVRNLDGVTPKCNDLVVLYAIWKLSGTLDSPYSQAVGCNNLELQSEGFEGGKKWDYDNSGVTSNTGGTTAGASELSVALRGGGSLVFRWQGTGSYYEGEEGVSRSINGGSEVVTQAISDVSITVRWLASGGDELFIDYVRWYPGANPDIPAFPDGDVGGGTGGGTEETVGEVVLMTNTISSAVMFVTVPNKWLQEYFPGEDKAEMAKRYCRSYVAGTNPTNGTEELKITSMTLNDNGLPSFTWEPDLSDANPPRKYTVYGKENLEDDWHVPVSVLDRFFTLSVELKP